MTVIFYDLFNVGADVDINAHPSAGAPDFAYSRGSGLQVNAAADNVQHTLEGVVSVARCISRRIPLNMMNQEVRGFIKSAGTAGNQDDSGAALRYSTSTRGYIGIIDVPAANEVVILEDNAGLTTLASADRGLLANTTYPISFKAVGPTNNTLLSLSIGGTAEVTFRDTTSVLGAPGVDLVRGVGTPLADTTFDDFTVDDLKGLDYTSFPKEKIRRGV